MVDSSQPGWSFLVALYQWCSTWIKQSMDFIPAPSWCLVIQIEMTFAPKACLRCFPLEPLERGRGDFVNVKPNSKIAKKKDRRPIRSRSICVCHKETQPHISSKTKRVPNAEMLKAAIPKFLEKRLIFQYDSNLRQCRERKQFCTELLS